ncbi:MAG: hypothetical protein ABIZ70_00205 [Gemmatimonadales bacterium]
MQIYSSLCVGEHGDSFLVYAGVDSAAQVFPLGSEVGLEFLRRVHPPVATDSSSVLDYARTALALLGLASIGDELLPVPSPLADSLARELGVQSTRFARLGVRSQSPAGALDVSLTLASARRVGVFRVLVSRNNGRVLVLGQDQFPRGP